jgi:hypothetical protein
MYPEIKADADAILVNKDLKAKGAQLEEFISRVFICVPGVEVFARDIKNDKGSQEIDLSLWNSKAPDGLYFLDHVILVECKNWASKASSSDISWFATKIKRAHKNFGIFISTQGITGSNTTNSAAHDTVMSYHQDGIVIMVITVYEIKHMNSFVDLIQLIKKKMCEMVLGKIIIKVTD